MNEPTLEDLIKESIQITRELSDVVKGLNARIGSLELRAKKMDEHHHKHPDTRLNEHLWSTGESTGLPLCPTAGEDAT